MCRQVQRVLRFQSTLPVRGATKTVGSTIAFDVISIHAPRAGSDRLQAHALPQLLISIHAPRAGSDLSYISIIGSRGTFQSTLPVRGATHDSNFIPSIPVFQSTLPVRGATQIFRIPVVLVDFNPRSPCGERRKRAEKNGRCYYFNPRSPCGERLYIRGRL